MSFDRSQKKLLSDHMPFIAKSKSEVFLSWNITYQMRFNFQWEYFNNGFNCPDETLDQYTHRLMHIAAKLADAAKTEIPGFICLQECPGTDEQREQFVKNIMSQGELQHYGIHLYTNNDDACYLITLHDAQRYKIENALSQAMSQFALSEGLKGKILPLVYSKAGEYFLVVNVHANFSKDVRQDVTTLYQRAMALGIQHVILLGDFNRDLVLNSDEYSKHDISQSLDSNHRFANDLYVSATSGTSFCSQYDKVTKQKSQRSETRDGTISTFPVDIACMLHINTPNLALSFKTELSPSLNSIPEGFLEKLSPKKYDASTNVTFEASAAILPANHC